MEQAYSYGNTYNNALRTVIRDPQDRFLTLNEINANPRNYLQASQNFTFTFNNCLSDPKWPEAFPNCHDQPSPCVDTADIFGPLPPPEPPISFDYEYTHEFDSPAYLPSYEPSSTASLIDDENVKEEDWDMKSESDSSDDDGDYSDDPDYVDHSVTRASIPVEQREILPLPVRAISEASSVPSSTRASSLSSSSYSVYTSVSAPLPKRKAQRGRPRGAIKEFRMDSPPCSISSSSYSAETSASAPLPKRKAQRGSLRGAIKKPRMDNPPFSSTSITTTSSSSENEFRCFWPMCPETFPTVEEAERHSCPGRGTIIDTHDKSAIRGSQLFRCGYMNCNHRTDNPGDMGRHLLTLAHRERGYRCKWCKTPFTRKDAQLRHQKNGTCKGKTSRK